MSEKAVLAVGAHPDDVEFMMAGTLILLKEAGYEPHIFTVANGSCGTTEYSREDIIRIRRTEAKSAAAAIGATYHQGLVDDIKVYYEENLLARVSAVVRQVNPEIILAPSPEDYMEDHQNTCRLIVTAAFCKGMRNFGTAPPVPPVTGDTFLYHALPYGLHDGMRRKIVPGQFTNISSVIDTKQEMLSCHKSQQAWLDTSQGMNQYLQTMRDMSAEVGKMSGQGWEFAEGWRQHSHLGFAEKDGDKLKDVLGDNVVLNKQSA